MHSSGYSYLVKSLQPEEEEEEEEFRIAVIESAHREYLKHFNDTYAGLGFNRGSFMLTGVSHHGGHGMCLLRRGAG